VRRPSDLAARPDPDSFPRLAARTVRFTLGEPHAITVTGSTVLFLRTRSGTDRTGLLWSYDVESATERLLADPAQLVGEGAEELSAGERARRERARESGAGIVGYSADEAGRTAVFALSGALWACRIATGQCHPIPTPGPVVDPRIDPTGRRIAYCCDGALRVVVADGTGERVLAEPDGEHVVWGQAEFVAAEEMDRYRGFWWAPDGGCLLVERYDESAVGVWYVADPAHPDREPVAHRYPAAGTANAEVSLWRVRLDGQRSEVAWDHARFPYLSAVRWTDAGAVAEVLGRDQRHAEVHRIDTDGEVPRMTLLAERSDPAWVDVVPGLPVLAADGRLVTRVADGDDPGASTNRLAVDAAPVSPVGVQVLRVLSAADDGVLALATENPTEAHLARFGYDGGVDWLSTAAGVYAGAADGDTVVVTRSGLDAVAGRAEIRRAGSVVGSLDNRSARAPFVPEVAMLTVGVRQLKVGLVLPRGHRRGSAPLPVVMTPYGGPHAQLVRASARIFLTAQWLADQGFAVIVADGRGSPGRGPAWERTVAGDLAAVTLADQVDALAGVADRYPHDVDTDRVGIMGWSYGGYLSALAVLERPDVFHAAVAGAPVTDWTLYDTCYTERYLGDPNHNPEAYRRNSLIDRASDLTRPLMLIHGLVDDNVAVAHTLRLSAALLAAGRDHRVLPLTGVTHMASAEDIAENLLLAQVGFLRSALG
jgi:dipeptidyl-peptidase-4